MIKPIAHNEDNLRVDGGVKSNSSTSSSIAIVNHQEGDTLTKFSFLPIPEQLSPVPWTHCHHDVFKGVFNGSVVAIKTFRIADVRDATESRKRLQRETEVWSHLSHTNLLPFLGVCNIMPSSLVPSLVTPWMARGNLNQYLRLDPGVDRLHIMLSVGSALDYLHSNHVVHGNLHAGNILFDDSGKAVLADFRITQIYDASRSSVFGDMSHVRYQAPELISGDAPSPTIACDVYAFGIVCYEALSETQPYSSFGTAVDVILAVYEGKAPFSHANKRIFDPPNLDEAFWDLMLSCWAGVPGHRPEIGQVFDGLKSISQMTYMTIPRQSHL